MINSGRAAEARASGRLTRIVFTVQIRSPEDVEETAPHAEVSNVKYQHADYEEALGEAVDLVALAAAGRLALPITHPDLTHMHLTGTGLTHLGSAATRDAMHAKLDGAETLTDSMKMFQMGLADGRPAAGQVGVQPEWFYKGNGYTAVAPGAASSTVRCACAASAPWRSDTVVPAPTRTVISAGW